MNSFNEAIKYCKSSWPQMASNVWRERAALRNTNTYPGVKLTTSFYPFVFHSKPEINLTLQALMTTSGVNDKGAVLLRKSLSKGSLIINGKLGLTIDVKHLPLLEVTSSQTLSCRSIIVFFSFLDYKN